MVSERWQLEPIPQNKECWRGAVSTGYSNIETVNAFDNQHVGEQTKTPAPAFSGKSPGKRATNGNERRSKCRHCNLSFSGSSRTFVIAVEMQFHILRCLTPYSPDKLGDPIRAGH